MTDPRAARPDASSTGTPPAAAALRPTRAHLILYVRDQERARAFYEAALGFAPRLHVPGMTEFEVADGAVLGLMPEAGIRRLLPALPDPAAANGAPRAETYLWVASPSAAHARALAAGATELSPVLPRDWGDDAGYCLDPDGHVLAFAAPLEGLAPVSGRTERPNLRVPDEAIAALVALEATLGRAPVAAFLSGSAVDGGLRPLSDVDVLVVVEEAPDADARQRLAAALMAVSGRYGAGGPVRPLDVTLVRLADVVPWRYPPTRAFAYGEWLRAAYEAGSGPARGPLPDLAIALAQVRARGVPLRGPHPRALLDPVPVEDLRRALRDALPALLADLRGDERNVLLTLARMWRTAVTGEFVPKDAAGAWAAAQLPADLGVWLERAGRAYAGLEADGWTDHRAEATAVAERLRREVERACGGPPAGRGG